MNEFTKEELEELMHCVYAYRDLCDEDVEDNLCDKLKFMIDNYCEHDYRIVTDLDHLKCVKCSKYFSVNGIH